jgi:predicted negative regulator of RcsB-dependent stress response
MLNGKTKGVILAISLSVVALIWLGYRYYQDRQQAAAQEHLNAELISCEQQADIHLQQYNATPLLPRHDGYLTEYNDAVALCKQEY